jgi:hypothetical protein
MLDQPIPQRQTNSGQAVAMFWRASNRGKLHSFWTWLTRRTSQLIDLEDALNGSIEASHYAGIKTVNIDNIRGSQGKTDAFDNNFNPIQETTRSRWLSIAIEKLRGRELPPVELFQLGNDYYVRDGHHRISVSRTLGQQFIEAEVTVIRSQQTMLR